MKFTNRKPKKIAKFTITTKYQYKAEGFANSKAATSIYSPTETKNVVSAIYSHFDKIKKHIANDEHLSGSGYRFEIVNTFIHTPFQGKVKILSEHKFRKVERNLYEIEVGFYAVDHNANFDKDEIIIPANSIVYQVADSNLFKAFVRDDGRLVFIRENKNQESVDITYIQGESYFRNLDGHFVRVDIVDNSDFILKSEVVFAIKKNTKAITFIRDDGYEVHIDKSEYKNERNFKLVVDTPSGKTNVSAKFVNYKRSDIHPALKGTVKALIIDDKVHLSCIRA